MNTDRFKDYQKDVKDLVLGFEAMQNSGESCYYDVDEIETIIDFYLETADGEMLEKSVRYAESLFPTSNEIRLRRVHLLCFKERYEEAHAILKKLERIEPENTDIQYALGVVYGALEQHRKAIRYYLKAAMDGYELGIIYSNIADEYTHLNQYHEARNYYRKALKINYNDERALYSLAECYEEEGATDKCVHYFINFVEEHPYSKVGWYCLGEGYLQESLYEKAIDAYEYALAIDSSFFNAYLQLSLCHFLSEDYDSAVNTLHDALKYTDDKADIYFRIAEIFKVRNNFVTANVYYRKAVQEDPYYGDAWMSMALCYSLTGQHTAAIDAIGRAIKSSPESPTYLTTLAVIYGDSGDDESAEKFFSYVTSMFAEFDNGWLAYADFLILRKRYDDAINLLSDGLPECDDTFGFNVRLAYCYFITGRRNSLYNAVRACLYEDNEGGKILLDYCPEMANDIEVMNIINSYRQESDTQE